MSFQAYIDNIKTKTGKTPADFKKLAEQKGFLNKGKLVEGIKAGEEIVTNALEFSSTVAEQSK